jgi:TPR repeat protein
MQWTAVIAKCQGVWRGRMLLAWACLPALAAANGAAASEDEVRRGEQAYRRGDVVGAMQALRPAARAGHAGAQVRLAFILQGADFAEEAARLYAAAAEQGHAEGHAGLAGLLLAGRGIAKDEKRALQHFSKAAEGGHELAIGILAQAYRTGSHGLAADPSQAAYWEARAAALRAVTPPAAANAAARTPEPSTTRPVR